MCFLNLASALTTIGPPTELITSEVTASSFMVNWTHAPGKVQRYRVVYYPTRGGKPEEVRRSHSISNHSFHSVTSSTVERTRRKCIHKEIVLSAIFYMVWLKYISTCPYSSLNSAGCGHYSSSHVHIKKTLRTAQIDISNMPNLLFIINELWSQTSP